MKKTIRVSLIVIAVLVVSGLLVGQFFYQVIFGITTRNDNLNIEDQLTLGVVDSLMFDTLNYDRIEIKSEFGYILNGFYIDNSIESNRTIIICHGVGANKYMMFKRIPMFLNLGYNVVLYDTRAHGESGGDIYSFGYYEKFDVETVVQFVKENYPSTILGLYGESMGAASVMQHIDINSTNKNVDFYIEDCGYSDLKELFAYRLKQDYGLPDVGIIAFASLITKLHDGYFFSDVRPIEAIENEEVPILFIHGEQDDYVPYFMGPLLFEAKKDNKRKYWAYGSKHAASYNDHPEVYEKHILAFLLQFNFIQ